MGLRPSRPPGTQVAATAVENAETLCTADVKHLRTIPGLTVKRFRP